MKKLLTILLCVLLAISVCACSQSNTDNNNETDGGSDNSDAQTTIDLGEPNLTKDNALISLNAVINDKIKINAEVITPEEINFTGFSAGYGSFEREKLQQELMPETAKAESVLKGEEGYNSNYYHYTDKNGADLTFITDSPDRSDSMLYRRNDKPFENHISVINRIEYSKYFTEGEVDGLSKDDAVAAAKEILAVAGIKNYISEPEIFTVNSENVQRCIENSESSKGLLVTGSGGPFTEDNEAYVLVFTKEYNGMPISADGWTSTSYESYMYEESNVFVVDREGVFRYELHPDIKIAQAQTESPKLYNADAVEKILADAFKYSFPTSSYEIYKIELAYACTSGMKNQDEITRSDEPLDYEPCWVCYVKGTFDDNEEADTGEPIIIKAATGEIVNSGGIRKVM